MQRPHTMLFAALALLGVGCGMLWRTPPPPIPPGPPLSFATDIAPIIAEKCMPCHFQQGGREAFREHPMDSYENVKGQADAVMEQVWTRREMPRRQTMTDDERTLIARWIEQGAAP